MSEEIEQMMDEEFLSCRAKANKIKEKDREMFRLGFYAGFYRCAKLSFEMEMPEKGEKQK